MVPHSTHSFVLAELLLPDQISQDFRIHVGKILVAININKKILPDEWNKIKHASYVKHNGTVKLQLPLKYNDVETPTYLALNEAQEIMDVGIISDNKLREDDYCVYGNWFIIWAQLEHICRLLYKDLNVADRSQNCTLADYLCRANHHQIKKVGGKNFWEFLKKAIKTHTKINPTNKSLLLEVINKIISKRLDRNKIMHGNTKEDICKPKYIERIQEEYMELTNVLKKLHQLRIDIFHPDLIPDIYSVTGYRTNVPMECSAVAQSSVILRWEHNIY